MWSKKHTTSVCCKKCNLNLRITKGKENRISLQTLKSEIKELGYVKVGEKYGVSDNAVRKWIKSYGLDPKQIK